MSEPPRAVLDASAVLAFWLEEAGAQLVEEALNARAAISAVNWAEALSKLSDLAKDSDLMAGQLTHRGTIGSALTVWPFDDRLARDTARLRRQTRGLRLSLGDRACLALGRALQVPVLTTDRLWMSLKLDVVVRLIR